MSVVEPVHVVKVCFVEEGIAPAKCESQVDSASDMKWNKRNVHRITKNTQQSKCYSTNKHELNSPRIYEHLQPAYPPSFSPLGVRVQKANETNTAHTIDNGIYLPMCAQSQEYSS